MPTLDWLNRACAFTFAATMPIDRYHASGPQADSQPGSDGLVLRNRLGITDPQQLQDAELQLLLQLYEFVLGEAFPERGIKVADLAEWHRLWLGNVYVWAGQLRSVNLGKGGFQFAAAAQLPRLLQDFELQCLRPSTPCTDMDGEALAQAIALCHVEFILIHPFREGNGRLSRLLADVMAMQAGHGLLDYTTWDADKTAYFAAIQKGMSRNYQPMQALVSAALTGPREPGRG